MTVGVTVDVTIAVTVAVYDQVTAVALVTELRDKGLPLRKATYTAVTDAFGPDALALVGRSPPPPESFLY